MKSLYLLFALLTLSSGLSAQSSPQTYEFAGLHWGADRPTVKAALATLGFRFDSTDADGDGWFRGTLTEEKAMVITWMTPQGQLSKIDVTLLTKDQDARNVYRSMKETLVSKYGSPNECVESFVKPYYEGDGYEEQAIRHGKGYFICTWGTKATGVLGIEITERLTVSIGYESPGWYAGESDRRKKKATAAF